MSSYTQTETKVNSEVNQLSGTPHFSSMTAARTAFTKGMTDAERAAFDAIPDAPAFREAGGRRAERRRGNRMKTLKWISSLIPHELRGLFRGVGVISVANYILEQIKRTGACNLYYAAIAAATGTARRTVQRTVRLLKLAGLDVRYGSYNHATGKNVATLIKTTSHKLYAWISRGVGGGGQQSPASKIIDTYFVRPSRNRSHKEAPNGNGLPP